jgi:enoyl-[acyl-carrier protein] reductase I
MRGSVRIPAAKAPLLEGKKGLIVGIANEVSMPGDAPKRSMRSAQSTITYLNDKAKPFVEPLARATGTSILMRLDVRVPGQMKAVFDRLG